MTSEEKMLLMMTAPGASLSARRTSSPFCPSQAVPFIESGWPLDINIKLIKELIQGGSSEKDEEQ